MIEGGTFNITSLDKPTNKDLIVSFSPATNTVKYTYTVFKDNKVLETKDINNNHVSNFYFEQTGTYRVTVITTDVNNTEHTITAGNYIIDKEAPVLNLKESYIEIYKGDEILLAKNITASDNQDGDITSKITNNAKEINLDETGNHLLTYTVSDEAGNITSKNLVINNLGSKQNLFFFQVLIIIALVLIAILVIRFIKSWRLEKRLEPFTISPLKDNTSSAFDRAINVYQKFLESVTTIYKKSVILQKYAKRLDKYSTVSFLHKNGTEILVGKSFLSIIFLIVAIIARTLQLKLLNPHEFIFPLLVGFFVLDLIYFIKYKAYRSKLENDLLSAIIIMNNAFKSGRSIVQAIDTVAKEVDGQIGQEFSKMSLELSYGLGIDVVFKRFAERVQLEEVNYLTASLTILNKTGGNIIEVFSSIEKSLFNKKKLRLELRSLTGSSRIIVYILLAVPFFFIIFVSLINPSYFAPFVTTKLGIILTIGMVIYYIIFIFFVRKIMKVVI